MLALLSIISCQRTFFLKKSFNLKRFTQQQPTTLPRIFCRRCCCCVAYPFQLHADSFVVRKIVQHWKPPTAYVCKCTILLIAYNIKLQFCCTFSLFSLFFSPKCMQCDTAINGVIMELHWCVSHSSVNLIFHHENVVKVVQLLLCLCNAYGSYGWREWKSIHFGRVIAIYDSILILNKTLPGNNLILLKYTGVKDNHVDGKWYSYFFLGKFT